MRVAADARVSVERHAATSAYPVDSDSFLVVLILRLLMLMGWGCGAASPGVGGGMLDHRQGKKK